MGTFRDLAAYVRMARDSWVENLRCPNCRKTGEAHLSATDEYSWDVRVDSFQKHLRLSGWRMAYPSFIVFRATSRWNYRVCRLPQLAASFVTGSAGSKPAPPLFTASGVWRARPAIDSCAFDAIAAGAS